MSSQVSDGLAQSAASKDQNKGQDVEEGHTDERNMKIGAFRDDEDNAYDKSLPPKFYIHKWRFVPSAVLAYFIFVIALVFYSYIRIREMPKLRNSQWFGWSLLILELIGSTATLVYGICQMFEATHDHIDVDLRGGPTRRHYHVRVLVPCYKEGLDILQATIMAAISAPLPQGCRRTIYLCDDGRDPEKKQWIESMDRSDMVYVTRPKPKQKQMNGKSNNVNNCLRNVIYRNMEVEEIPLNEVIVIFDADQVAKENFYIRLLPFMDAGDNVALVLTPQTYYNIPVMSDIFNHNNPHFWEYLLPGLEGMQAMFCTGSNFLLRARALAEANWFPTDSVTEDYELGMVLTTLQWRYIYRKEYLAIGECPEELGNSFQQRSRWSKGPFQVLFRKNSTYWHPKIAPIQRMLFLMTPYGYFTGSLIPPILFWVPVFGIVTGFDPFPINFWTICALTVFYVGGRILVNYSRSWSHLLWTWFATTASIILWPVFLKAWWNTLKASMTGKVIEFKATAKGGSQGIDYLAALKEVWTHFFMMFVAVLIAVIDLIGQDKVFPLVPANKTSQQSVLTRLNPWWCIFNSVPYYLVVHYSLFGVKLSMRVACGIAYILQTVIIVYVMFIFWQPETWDPSYDVSASTNFGSCDLVSAGSAIAKLAIPLNSVYAGVYIPAITQARYNEVVAKTGVRHVIHSYYAEFPKVVEDEAEKNNLALFLKINRKYKSTGLINVVTPQGFGSYDFEQVQDFADLLRDSCTKTLINYNPEMNANWFVWGQKPEAYKQKYIEFASAVYSTAPQAAMVWAPAQQFGYPYDGFNISKSNKPATFKSLDTNNDGVIDADDDPFSPYFPGSNYVDWVGMQVVHSGQNPQTDEIYYSSPPESHFFEQAISSIHSFARENRRPLIVTSTSTFFSKDKGFGGTDNNEVVIKSEWIEQVYNIKNSTSEDSKYSIAQLNVEFPYLKAIVWNNNQDQNFGQYPAKVDEVDYSVTSNSAVREAYYNALSHDYFVKGPEIREGILTQKYVLNQEEL